MTVIGVTGNSGSGKDTVAELIKSEIENSLIVDADHIVKEHQKPGNDYYNGIVELIGKNALTKEKNIDRQIFAKKLFSDEELRKNVNKLTFECVEKELEKILEENQDKNYVILNFPLLYEGGFEKYCEFVIAVTAEEETKIKRIIIRDKISRSSAIARIESQKSEYFYQSHADFIIDNSNNVTYGKLREEVQKTIKSMKEKE